MGYAPCSGSFFKSPEPRSGLLLFYRKPSGKSAKRDDDTILHKKVQYSQRSATITGKYL